MNHGFALPALAEWPEAEFIIGNPPFIGKGAKMRSALKQPYLDAMWAANTGVPKSANYVMQWWDRAARILSSPNTTLKRFGFVTTNTISQRFNRRIMERYLNAPAEANHPLSLVYAVADHPWTKSTGAAMVRIAMTVCARGVVEGKLDRVVREEALDTDSPIVELVSRAGAISSKLTVGADTTRSVKLHSNDGIATNGVLLAGRGFVLSNREAEMMAGKIANPAEIIRPYLAGAEIMQTPRHRFVIDFSGLSEREAARRAPAAYQHLLETVAVARKAVAEERKTPDAISYAENWWRFAKERVEFRTLQRRCQRFIATTETTKFRVFQFIDSAAVTDHMIVGIALEDYFSLGVLSSSTHYYWKMAKCGMMGVATKAQGHRYTKSEIFDTFPFPTVSNNQRNAIGQLAQDLDDHRKAALAETPGLTMTEIYNLRSKTICGELTNGERDRATTARVGIIDRLHQQIDQAVTKAYGWSTTLAPEEIVAQLVALNAERAAEEQVGTVRWLRPEYQEVRFRKG